jgi:hypothetical protein
MIGTASMVSIVITIPSLSLFFTSTALMTMEYGISFLLFKDLSTNDPPEHPENHHNVRGYSTIYLHICQALNINCKYANFPLKYQSLFPYSKFKIKKLEN